MGASEDVQAPPRRGGPLYIVQGLVGSALMGAITGIIFGSAIMVATRVKLERDEAARAAEEANADLP